MGYSDETEIIKIMPFGKFYHSVYGEVEHTKAMAVEMIRNFRNNVTGYPIPLYIDHSEAEGKLGEVRWLELEKDGLYATVEFNQKGVKKLKGSQYDYVSPAYAEKYKAKKTGEWTDTTLLEVSFTNKPGQVMEKLNLAFKDENAEHIKQFNFGRGEKKMDGTNAVKMYEDLIAEQKENIKKLTDEVDSTKKEKEEEIKKLTDAVNEKDLKIKELTDKVEAVEKEKFAAEVESWAKDWGSKGKAPAIVNKFKEQVLSGEIKKEFADDVLKEVPSITPEGTEQAVNMTENYDKIAKTLAEM